MANYVLLEKITVGAAGASSVTFSGIPQTGYTDLVIRGSVRTTQAATYGLLSIRPNGSTANITGIRMYAGDGNVYSDNTPTLALISGDNTGANTFGSFETYITNYASSSFKTFTSQSTGERNQTNDTYMGTSTILWSDTTAITSLEIMPNAVGFISGCTFYLYGVAKLGTTPAIQAKATGGDIIETDGTYWYHAFLSSGTFTPATNLSCDVLVLAGGGGGGGAPFNQTSTGGGGAGGLLLHSATSAILNTAVTVTVGAGGAGGSGASGTAGSNSTFGALTASVGGGRGGAHSGTGGNGGSGGGGGTGADGGTATSGQGFNGGSGYSGNSGNYAGGGGGGAGAVGQAAQQSPGAYGSGGAGGAGVNTYSSWLSVVGLGVSGFIAGGGGGGAPSGGGTAGAGGSGGGGAGVVNTASPGGSGTANTGSGGGGTGYGLNPGPAVGGAGGSGLVIVRYVV